MADGVICRCTWILHSQKVNRSLHSLMRIDDGSAISHFLHSACREGGANVCHATLLQSGFKHYVRPFKELLSSDLPSIL